MRRRRRQKVATVSFGDRIVARPAFRDTHRGKFLGIPPTGRQVTVAWIAFYRLADETGSEECVVRNVLGLLQHIGAIPLLRAIGVPSPSNAAASSPSGSG